MIRLPWLDPDDLSFPHPDQALTDPNGLLAVGGDLSPARLLTAYRHGIFPWYEEGQPILWWSPQPRAVLLPNQVHVSRSLHKVMRRGELTVSADTCFDRVIAACAGPRRDAAGTWITGEMAEAYSTLHQMGYAHSVETWYEGQLVGGLYGIAIGRAFFGESMFSRADNASKVALVTLARQLELWGFGLIDCQMETAHLRSLGATLIRRSDFRAKLLDYTQSENDPAFAPRHWSLGWNGSSAG